MTIEYETEIGPYTLRGNVITGDYEGDADVPGGIHHLDPYPEDVNVFVGPPNAQDDITNDLKDDVYLDLVARFTERALDQ